MPSGKSNAELEKEQKATKLRPDELKDTDVEDEWNEGDKKGFRKENVDTSTKRGGDENAAQSMKKTPKTTNEQLEKEQSQMHLKPDQLKDTDVEDEYKEKDGGAFRKNSGKARL